MDQGNRGVCGILPAGRLALFGAVDPRLPAAGLPQLASFCTIGPLGLLTPPQIGFVLHDSSADAGRPSPNWLRFARWALPFVSPASSRLAKLGSFGAIALLARPGPPPTRRRREPALFDMRVQYTITLFSAST
jgi:hypothetical protein